MYSMIDQWKCGCGYHNMVLRSRCRDCGAENPAGPVLERVGEKLSAGAKDPAEEAFALWQEARLNDPIEGRGMTYLVAFMAGVLHEREACAFLAETHGGFYDAATIAAIAKSIRERSLGQDGPDAVHLTRRRYEALLAAEEELKKRDYQPRVRSWLVKCFGQAVSYDLIERAHRFLEEAMEFAQALGCTEEEAVQLAAYVFNRDIGDRHQEAGGVMVTFAAACMSASIDMRQAGEDELARVSSPAMIERVRAKNAAKPRRSPLPGQIDAAPVGGVA